MNIYTLVDKIVQGIGDKYEMSLAARNLAVKFTMMSLHTGKAYSEKDIERLTKSEGIDYALIHITNVLGKDYKTWNGRA